MVGVKLYSMCCLGWGRGSMRLGGGRGCLEARSRDAPRHLMKWLLYTCYGYTLESMSIIQYLPTCIIDTIEQQTEASPN